MTPILAQMSLFSNKVITWIIFKRYLHNYCMESTPTLADAQLNSLAICMLDHHKSGEFAFNEDTDKQSSSHYNNKRYVKEALSEWFNDRSKKHKINKYMDSLIMAIKHLDQEEALKVREKNNELIIRNRFLESQNVLIRDGQTKNTCGSCHLNISQYKQEFREKFITEYICEKEDVNLLTNHNDCLNQENIILSKNLNITKTRLQTYQDNYKMIPNEEYETFLSKCNSSESKPTNMTKNQLSKEIKRLKKQKRKMESSDSESDSD